MALRNLTLGLLVTLAAACLPSIPEPEQEPQVQPQDTGVPQPDNLPPTADAGPPHRVPVGTRVELLGSSSDPDGERVEVRWTVVSAPEGSYATLREREGTNAAFDPDVVGAYEIELEVTDAEGATAVDDVFVEAVDSWDASNRPAPGHVYLLGSVDQFVARPDPCKRGIGALGRVDGPALVALDCRPAPESVHVQDGGGVAWFDPERARALQMECDGPCLVFDGRAYPETNPALNDLPLELPCDEPDRVIFGPDARMARCGSRWHHPRGTLRDRDWWPIAAGADGLVLLRGPSGQIGVMDMTTQQVQVTEPPLEWQFLRAWRSHEDGFRVAAFDERSRTRLVEVDPSGRAEPVATYTPAPAQAVVRVGSRLDSAGDLYSPVQLDGRLQVLRYRRDGGVEVVHDDADDPLLQLGLVGELVTGP